VAIHGSAPRPASVGRSFVGVHRRTVHASAAAIATAPATTYNIALTIDVLLAATKWIVIGAVEDRRSVCRRVSML
jgi:hypothetical protein